MVFVFYKKPYDLFFFAHTGFMDKNKKKNKGINDFDLELAAWQMFNQTGSVAHYLLYKRLKDKKD